MTYEQQHESNLRDLALIRNDPAWALSRVIRARELEAEVQRLREALAEIAEKGAFSVDAAIARRALSEEPRQRLTPEAEKQWREMVDPYLSEEPK